MYECADHGLGSIAGAGLEADLCCRLAFVYLLSSHFSEIWVIGFGEMGAYLD